MFSSKNSRYFVIFLLYHAISNNAYANGINPPRPAASVEVKAICEEFSGEIHHEIYKAHITNNDSHIDKISFLEGGGNENVLPIARIRSIEFSKGEVDEKGFLGGIIDDGNGNKNVKLYIGNNNNLLLTGFKYGENDRFKIDLKKCRKIIFSVSEDSSLPKERIYESKK